jgi:hypothetical protein
MEISRASGDPFSVHTDDVRPGGGGAQENEMRRVGWLLVGGVVSLLSGCPGPGPGGDPDRPIFPHPDRPLAESLFMDPRIQTPGISPADAPPPISGGTLHVLEGARAAIVADPDRDRILVVDLAARRVMGETTHLPPGAEPGRVT